MSTSLQSRLKRAGRWLPVAALPFLSLAAQAQTFNYLTGNATNPATPSTYTDLGTTGTAIATLNTDDDNSAAQTIGFNFSFNGTTFTQFVLNTNGLIRLGSAAPSSAAAFPSYAQAAETGPISGTNATDVNLIAPFNIDLSSGAAGPAEYRFITTGTAPNRVCTIQWKNVADKAQAVSAMITTVLTTQLANFSFQAKLYETSNTIEFVYGTATAGTGTAAAKYVAVGIKGSAPAESVLATKMSSAAWSTTTFMAGPYLAPAAGNAHNVRQTFLPDAGRTYRFVPGAVPPPSPATYATLPYTEGFEGPWINDRGTSDSPTINWHNTPITGDNSWRREDDGFTSAGWRYVDNEMPTAMFPIPPYVTRFSAGAHSARFHSFGAGPIPAGGTIQGRLDLYVNLSGTGSKTLSFDYINPSGADKVDVLLSTDGGATFSTAPLLTVTTSSVFANKAVTITSSSATSVIRFQATSDYGNDDIGLDNLRLSVVTATRNEALAAAVSVAPNPAHQRFTLSVPAGSLRTASATLANTLGQVVATRQLNLPAAGGSTDFDVSRLAAGIYTLTLQSGNDLVVKRVVVE